MLRFIFAGKAKKLWKELALACYLESKGFPAWQYWVALTDFDWQGGSYVPRKDGGKELHRRFDNNDSLGTERN